MNHRIQIVVDEQLNESIKAGAKKMGLSISSFARLVLLNGLSRKNGGLLNQAIQDVNKNQVEPISFTDFSDEIDDL